MSHATVAQLRPVDLFEGLSDAELEPWAEAAELRILARGELTVEQGQPPAFHLVLEGALEALAVDENGRAEPVGEHSAPTWVGAIAVLTNGVSSVRMIATSEEVVLGRIEPGAFTELALADRRVFDRVMSQVRPVVSRIAAIEQNRERLASLGTMAAGLAHELNNPAAAARRAAADLLEALEVVSSTIGHFVESGIEREDAARLVELQRAALATCRAHTALSALDAADAEDELLDALSDLGVPEAWRLAEPLSAAGLDRDWLQRVAALAGPAAVPALQWVAASISAQSLARELSESTERMSSLVSAVKSYAYMDRGELVEADVHEGLETTLAVLGHKLKHTGIEVQRDYDRSLPRLTLHGGELNQVWTNLLDNAIQALGDQGTITIATALDGPCARVDIGDDGPGIDPGVLGRIWEPFFTTKAVGQGTGLGLDTARRIVVERHRGSIDVESRPGATVFHVWLPLQGAIAAPAASPEKEVAR
ncbi:MAG TPA: ATP-binding protein [Solirubrobacteraceae bacterium]|jgi:signal transduction histidine kinase|nr:ATP-binding protein [Solirubrobacteraceae bacterium]